MKKIYNFSPSSYILLTFGLLVVAAGILYIMGRNPICQCGYILLWEGVVGNAGNSQHILDFYTFSHIIHGFAFFAILSKFLKKKIPLGMIFLLAICIEILWEIIENTPWSINRYRNGTVSSEYIGDSILNSLSDITAMMSGFWLAHKLPWKVTFCLFLLMEIGTAWAIRDGLMLNIIMFLFPIDALKQWQMNG